MYRLQSWRDGLPPGWTAQVRRHRNGVGFVASGYYDVENAPEHVRAEAGPNFEYDHEIIRFWRLRESTARRELTEAIELTEGCPRGEWLGAQFAAGKPEAMLTGIPSGTPIGLKYSTHRVADPVLPVTDLVGELQVEEWTSIGKTYRAYYLVPIGAPITDTVCLSEFGLVWDVHVFGRPAPHPHA